MRADRGRGIAPRVLPWLRAGETESLPRGLFAVRQLLVRVDLHDIAEEDLVLALGTAVRFMCYTDHNGVGGYAVTSSSAP